MTPWAPADLTVVTGGAGWFGRAFLDAVARPRPEHGPVARDGQVRVLAASPAEVPHILEVLPRAVVHVGDLADPDVAGRLLADASGASVIHAAGVIHPARVADFERVNVGGTRALLEAATHAGVRRVVHLSSNSAFGVNPTPDDRFRQHEPYRPHLGYGRSKMRAERLVLDAAASRRLDTVVVRPPWFYGPFQPARQTTFFAMVAAGRFPVLGDGQQVRSMAYVDNLVQGVALAEHHPEVSGQAFWVADREPYTMERIVMTVQRVLEEEGYRTRGRQLRLPALLGRLAERVDGTLQARGVYHQQLHVLGEMDKTIACDVSATVDVLGYRPQVDLAEGMRRAVRWCADHDLPVAPRRSPR
ncbi:NAD(P)-dependent oxidoreductase [Nocardioides sp. cx-173]|uniref:NAD-dependent epimerase/dehydratase family protein n=1 Tax=Nocardioides sp. cx-173 TaxID=2898796 RepID=UPI001E5A65D7|nr:NAD(P)-dependent oxidoreductase [Nocardioides sp. cx-173]MCD4526398.1 NAD(P)-dependent oxidoreductase [Nocardioides sp. cx-173]UGB43569.1 NAD(P)-dependent oxidoreductase [Nocardioides sp. cx-173]